jgi:hypothetical protein
MKQARLENSIKVLYKKGQAMKKAKKAAKKQKKIEKVMHEYKEGELHSSSKKGPKVTNPKQAVAIAISESKKVGKKSKKK